MNKEVSIIYCPAKQVLADYLTKPLQGSQFQTFRDQIMNTNPTSDPHLDNRSVLEKVEAAGQTDDGWNLLTCKRTTGDRQVQIEMPTNSNRSKQTRETNRFTMLNLSVNEEGETTSTLKESVHKREGKEVREAICERIGDCDYSLQSSG